mmetsp:Transcript_42359/g.102070  ORF Transcript_42359/g.102070 Transcript_42359/m.102070 type:complete len:299 (+) Transcript_42359:593-1489(+)
MMRITTTMIMTTTRTMISTSFTYLLLFFILFLTSTTTIVTVDGLVVPSPVAVDVALTASQSSISSLLLLSSSASSLISSTVTDPEDARNAFFLWFFGGSGASGIALSAFPRMYEDAQKIQSMKGQGPTLGGETLGLSPLIGYPEDLCIADIEAIVKNPMPVETMVKKFPVEGNFMASRYGYLTYEAFSKANDGKNELAVRAIFDTFNRSTNIVEPDKAQEMLDEYKNDIRSINSRLLKSKLVGASSIATLLFLLGYACIIIMGNLCDGWFPEWPGGANFPWSLLDEDGAIWNIPKYWV